MLTLTWLTGQDCPATYFDVLKPICRPAGISWFGGMLFARLWLQHALQCTRNCKAGHCCQAVDRRLQHHRQVLLGVSMPHGNVHSGTATWQVGSGLASCSRHGGTVRWLRLLTARGAIHTYSSRLQLRNAGKHLFYIVAMYCTSLKCLSLQQLTATV